MWRRPTDGNLVPPMPLRSSSSDDGTFGQLRQALEGLESDRVAPTEGRDEGQIDVVNSELVERVSQMKREVVWLRKAFTGRLHQVQVLMRSVMKPTKEMQRTVVVNREISDEHQSQQNQLRYDNVVTIFTDEREQMDKMMSGMMATLSREIIRNRIGDEFNRSIVGVLSEWNKIVERRDDIAVDWMKRCRNTGEDQDMELAKDVIARGEKRCDRLWGLAVDLQNMANQLHSELRREMAARASERSRRLRTEQALIAAEHATMKADNSVKQLECRISSMKLLMEDKENERMEVDDQVHSLKDQLRKAMGKVDDLERRIESERQLVESLQGAQRQHEMKWLQRIEEMRSGMEEEHAAWIQHHEAQFQDRCDQLRRRMSKAEHDAADREQQLRQRHEQELAQYTLAHNQELEDQRQINSALQRKCDPSIVQLAVKNCTEELQAKFDAERAEWTLARKSALEEHETLRTQLAQCRGLLNRSRTNEGEVRARYAEMLAGFETIHSSLDTKVADAIGDVRLMERCLSQQQLSIWRCGQDQIINEKNLSLGSLQTQSDQMIEWMVKSQRSSESVLFKAQAVSENALALHKQTQNQCQQIQSHRQHLIQIKTHHEENLLSVNANCSAATAEMVNRSKDALDKVIKRHELQLSQRLDALYSDLTATFNGEIAKMKNGSNVNIMNELQSSYEAKIANAIDDVRTQEQIIHNSHMAQAQVDHDVIAHELSQRMSSVQDDSRQVVKRIADRHRLTQNELDQVQDQYHHTLSRIGDANDEFTRAQIEFGDTLANIKKELDDNLRTAQVTAKEVSSQMELRIQEILSEADRRNMANSVMKVDELRQRLGNEWQTEKQLIIDQHCTIMNGKIEDLNRKHKEDLHELEERGKKRSQELLEQENVKAKSECHRLMQLASLADVRADDERRRLVSEHNLIREALDRRVHELSEQIQQLQRTLQETIAGRDEADRSHEIVLEDMTKRERQRIGERDQQHQEMMALLQQKHDDVVSELTRATRRYTHLRKQMSELDQTSREVKSRVEDRDRIRELEVDVGRQQSEAEQLANEVRFYKLELENRDESLLKKYSNRGSHCRSSATIPARLRLSPVVDNNTHAGFGPSKITLQRNTQPAQHP